MPTAQLPTTPLGWLVAIVAALAGLLTGLLTIKLGNQLAAKVA